MVEYLINIGAKIDSKNSVSVHYKQWKSYYCICFIIFSIFVKFNIKDGDTSLLLALKQQNKDMVLDMVKVLLKKGAKVSFKIRHIHV